MAFSPFYRTLDRLETVKLVVISYLLYITLFRKVFYDGSIEKDISVPISINFYAGKEQYLIMFAIHYPRII